jgi:hypothetical protein
MILKVNSDYFPKQQPIGLIKAMRRVSCAVRTELLKII